MGLWNISKLSVLLFHTECCIVSVNFKKIRELVSFENAFWTLIVEYMSPRDPQWPVMATSLLPVLAHVSFRLAFHVSFPKKQSFNINLAVLSSATQAPACDRSKNETRKQRTLHLLCLLRSRANTEQWCSQFVSWSQAELRFIRVYTLEEIHAFHWRKVLLGSHHWDRSLAGDFVAPHSSCNRKGKNTLHKWESGMRKAFKAQQRR